MNIETGYKKLLNICIKHNDLNQSLFIIEYEEGTRNQVKEAVQQKIKLCGGRIADPKQKPDFFVVQREPPFSKQF